MHSHLTHVKTQESISELSLVEMTNFDFLSIEDQYDGFTNPLMTRVKSLQIRNRSTNLTGL